MWKLTASRRPARSSGCFANGSATASLQTELPGGTVTEALPPNVTGRLEPSQQRRAAPLQADIHAVERHGLGAERVAEPDARLAAPQIGPHDQAKCLIPRAGRGIGEGEFLLGLGGRVADGIGALDRTGP